MASAFQKFPYQKRPKRVKLSDNPDIFAKKGHFSNAKKNTSLKACDKNNAQIGHY